MENPKSPSKGGNTTPLGPDNIFYCSRRVEFKMTLFECVGSYLKAESYGPLDNPCRHCHVGSKNRDTLSELRRRERQEERKQRQAVPQPAPVQLSVSDRHRRALSAIANQFPVTWFSPMDLRNISMFSGMDPRDRLALLSEMAQAGCILHLGSRYMVREGVWLELKRQGDL